MSLARIRTYRARIDKLKRTSGSSLESVLRSAFERLLQDWAEAEDLVFAPELPLGTGPAASRVPDGTILHAIRVPLGYWEAKDSDDDLDEEIAKKRAVGYPVTNIIFEDTETAVLIQDGRERMRCAMDSEDDLTRLVSAFFAWEPAVVGEWRRAVEQFQQDMPHVLGELRERIDAAYDDNATFRTKARAFLEHARETVNPKLEEADIREMLIQHILTENIFARVFDEGEFHRHNNIAKELYALEELFLAGTAKREMLRGLRPYYTAIEKAATEITAHAEKQTFLKVIYESFYKVYNPNAADRLGVVYTPNEIVRFMIRGADWLCQKHFGKALIDEGVEILDPATGTGTFICELLEHFRGQQGLHRKYKQELHANEVAILPYYVANLNIEATFAAVSGQLAEFENLCFVDTLDNVSGLGVRSGMTPDLFAAFSDENVERVNRQNRRKISVVIGNPPYNAWQENYNDNNANRKYPKMDQRIKESYVRRGTAQNQNSVYDMYTRFFRWASDRLPDEGIICFVTGRKPFSKMAYDGFRAELEDEFSDITVVDLGGDVVDNPELSGTKHNVFGIKVGVAVSFLVKTRKKGDEAAKIQYVRRPENATAAEKLDWLADRTLEATDLEAVPSGAPYVWLDRDENDWSDLVPVASKEFKAGKRGVGGAIFRMISNGVKTQRDDWVYDLDPRQLERKARFLAKIYARTKSDPSHPDRGLIKWDRELTKYAKGKVKHTLDRGNIREAAYRPFTPKSLYFGKHFNGMVYQLPGLVGHGDNTFITISDLAYRADYCVFSTMGIPDLHFGASQDAYQCLPRYRYTPTGERIDNITDWALTKFTKHYGKRAGVSKDAIFHYVYAALHDPVWRETYAINLKREFPRISFHDDFARWVAWGERLMELHIGYEDADPWPIEREDSDAEPGKPRLKPYPAEGRIEIDGATTLTGFPPEAWTYRLGNRAGLDWVLDQHKEKKVRDKTVEAWLQDNPDARYCFADHKARVIDLLARVATVSVETMRIVRQMADVSTAD